MVTYVYYHVSELKQISISSRQDFSPLVSLKFVRCVSEIWLSASSSRFLEADMDDTSLLLSLQQCLPTTAPPSDVPNEADLTKLASVANSVVSQPSQQVNACSK